MTTGHEEVAAEIGEDDVLDPEPVHAIDADEDAGIFIPTRIELADGPCDGAQRKLQAGARMYPGQRENTRRRCDRLDEAIDDLLFADAVDAFVQ